jgi:shikimate dehydrogenase
MTPDFYAVIGNPISHSLSPKIHTLFAQQTNQELNYQAILVESSNLEIFIKNFPGQGLNITAPFKEQALQYVHALSPSASAIKAINTIKYFPDGKRYGDNTDAAGFSTDTKTNHKMILQNKRIALLGAGGAARAIVYAISKESPASLLIANRTLIKAQTLAAEFNATACTLENFNYHSIDVLINTASATGLNLPNIRLNPALQCYDINYYPAPTAFQRWAQQNGAIFCQHGLGMLIEQAAHAFYLWRGVKPDILPLLSIVSVLPAIPELS